MKKILLCALLALGIGLPLGAQTKVKTTDLVGLWQMTIKDEFGGVHYISVFKQMFADGKYHTFVQPGKTQAKPFIITNQGTYKLLNDSTIREHIDASITDGAVIGKDNDLTYSMSEDKNYLYVSYFMPGDSRRWQEVWVRLEMPKVDHVPGTLPEL